MRTTNTRPQGDVGDCIFFVLEEHTCLVTGGRAPKEDCGAVRVRPAALPGEWVYLPFRFGSHSTDFTSIVYHVSRLGADLFTAVLPDTCTSIEIADAYPRYVPLRMDRLALAKLLRGTDGTSASFVISPKDCISGDRYSLSPKDYVGELRTIYGPGLSPDFIADVGDLCSLAISGNPKDHVALFQRHVLPFEVLYGEIYSADILDDIRTYVAINSTNIS